jgi:uncharacterized protein YidB (DUF937 family)
MQFKPSMTALLGLAAVAGWENRDKIADFVKGLQSGGASSAAAQIPGGLGGALTGLVNHLQQNGAGNAANSWVGTGANLPITGAQLSQALGPDVMAKLTATTGLSADQLVSQLSQVLPQLVDKLTPSGQLPKA